jgi:hypothetical protein
MKFAPKKFPIRTAPRAQKFKEKKKKNTQNPDPESDLT